MPGRPKGGAITFVAGYILMLSPASPREKRMDLLLDRKSALITGGSGAIGKAVARRLLAEGARATIAARTESSLREATEELSRGGGRITYCIADTRDEDDVKRMAQVAHDQMGSIDILVNAAAEVGAPGPSGDDTTLVRPHVLAEEMDTKVLGYLRCAQAVVPYMIEQSSGRIVNIGGTAAYRTGSVSGSIRNAGVSALTKNLSDDLGEHGIGVNAIHPCLTWTEALSARLSAGAASTETSADDLLASMTERTAFGRLPTPDEIAVIVAFLSSPLASTLSGEAIVVGGGLKGWIRY